MSQIIYHKVFISDYGKFVVSPKTIKAYRQDSSPPKKLDKRRKEVKEWMINKEIFDSDMAAVCRYLFITERDDRVL